MRRTVHHPVPAGFSSGRRQPKGRVAGYVWKCESAGRWRFETASEPSSYGETFRSQRDAEAACLVADITQRLERDVALVRAQLTAERDTARDAFKASADLGICMDVVCNYRGPRGERFAVEFVAAT